MVLRERFAISDRCFEVPEARVAERSVQRPRRSRPDLLVKHLSSIKIGNRIFVPSHFAEQDAPNLPKCGVILDRERSVKIREGEILTPQPLPRPVPVQISGGIAWILPNLFVHHLEKLPRMIRKKTMALFGCRHPVSPQLCELIDCRVASISLPPHRSLTKPLMQRFQSFPKAAPFFSLPFIHSSQHFFVASLHSLSHSSSSGKGFARGIGRLLP
jgi:hypothetical protein